MIDCKMLSVLSTVGLTFDPSTFFGYFGVFFTFDKTKTKIC